MKKGIIFDLDGTLINTIGDIADSVNTVLASHGYPVHPEQAYRKMVGNGAKKLIERALPPGTDESTIKKMLALYLPEYATRLFQKTSPYPGTEDFLTEVKSRGYLLAVLSNKSQELSAKSVEHFFSGLFDLVMGEKAPFAPKPDPGSAFHIIKTLGLSRTWYIGDSSVDCQTALAAGLPFGGCLWGFRDRDELKETGCRFFLESWDDGFAFLDQ
jgi:phosphoglycolate phosphatase